MALCPDVAPFADDRFDRCDLLQRGGIHHGTASAAVRPSMTQAQERDECMWELAYQLARSGGHRSYQSIESELSGLGYRKAHSLLDNETARERLDRMCAGARKAFAFVSA